MFQGLITALITPFRNNELDEKALCELIDWQIAEGVQGLVLSGTTGEAPALSAAEYARLLKVGIAHTAGRVPVIAGSGTNATDKTIEATRVAKELGADGALVTMPYYNKPTQKGLRLHFEALHNAVDIPIILYNVPSRCGVDMSVETMAQLAKLKNIVGVKDATNDLARPLLTRLACGPEFILLTGENSTVGAFLAQGGAGGIMVTSNIAPRAMRDLMDAWNRRDIETFSRLNELLVLVSESLFTETNPIPTKYALAKMGWCSPEIRLPLCQASQITADKVDAALERLKAADYLSCKA